MQFKDKDCLELCCQAWLCFVKKLVAILYCAIPSLISLCFSLEPDCLGALLSQLVVTLSSLIDNYPKIIAEALNYLIIEHRYMILYKYSWYSVICNCHDIYYFSCTHFVCIHIVRMQSNNWTIFCGSVWSTRSSHTSRCQCCLETLIWWKVHTYIITYGCIHCDRTLCLVSYYLCEHLCVLCRNPLVMLQNVLKGVNHENSDVRSSALCTLSKLLMEYKVST